MNDCSPPVSTWELSLVGVILVAIILIPLASFFLFNSCEKTDTIEGYLSGTTNGFDLIIDNSTFYVTDYYFADKQMPVDFCKYYNHNVKITYSTGCGRCLIYDVKIID